VTIDIEAVDCTNNRGAQYAIYKLPVDSICQANETGVNPDSLASNIISDCTWAACSLDTFEMTVKTVPGNIYGFLIDGCDGDICDVNLSIITDSVL
jgi:hypothetical protein